MKERRLLYAIGWVDDRFIEEMEEESVVHHRSKRLWLLAALIALAALLVGCGILYGLELFTSPAEMISSIFGNETGYDSKEITLIPNQDNPESQIRIPGFARVPVDEKGGEDVVPHVSAIGKTLTFHDVTLTIDGFLYDSNTACGLVTFTIEAPKEKLIYEVEPNGRIWFQSLVEPDFSRSGESYIISSKTTNEKLAATYYFENPYWDADTEFSVKINDGMTGQSIMNMNAAVMDQMKAKYSPDEARMEAKKILTEMYGESEAEKILFQNGDPAKSAYELLRDKYMVENSEKIEQESYSHEKIVFNLSENMALDTVTLAEGDIIISPFSLWLNAEHMEFLEPYPDGSVHSDSIHEIAIRFASDQEYLIYGDGVDNTIICTGAAVFGDGTSDTTRLSIVFNRIIDVRKIVGVSINGTEIE